MSVVLLIHVEKPLERGKAKYAFKAFNEFKLLFGAFDKFSERGQLVIKALYPKLACMTIWVVHRHPGMLAARPASTLIRDNGGSPYRKASHG